MSVPRSAPALVAVLLLAAAASAQPPAPAPNPRPADAVARVDALLGTAAVLDKATADVVDALRQDDHRKLAQAYHRFVRTHAQLADLVQESAGLVGQARCRLELAGGFLADLRKPGAVVPGGTELAVLRGQLLAQLQAARERYQQADGDARRGTHLSEVRRLVTEVEQLDDWAAAVRQGGPVVGPAQVDRLERVRGGMTARLDREERLLAAVSASLGDSLAGVSTGVRRATTLLRARATLPHGPLEQLGRQHEAVRKLVADLRAARAELVGVPPAGAEPPAPADDTLKRADRLLRPAGGVGP